MSQTQSLRSHTRFFPPFHFFILPVLLLNIAFSIYITIHHWPQHRAIFLWSIVLSLTIFVLAGISRGSALKAQDRIIRLEERLRLAALLPPSALKRCQALTEAQLIALRFASDEELPALSERAVTEHLLPKDIKQAITSWRPDHFRI